MGIMFWELRRVKEKCITSEVTNYKKISCFRQTFTNTLFTLDVVYQQKETLFVSTEICE